MPGKRTRRNCPKIFVWWGTVAVLSRSKLKQRLRIGRTCSKNIGTSFMWANEPMLEKYITTQISNQCWAHTCCGGNWISEIRWKLFKRFPPSHTRWHMQTMNNVYYWEQLHTPLWWLIAILLKHRGALATIGLPLDKAEFIATTKLNIPWYRTAGP